VFGKHEKELISAGCYLGRPGRPREFAASPELSKSWTPGINRLQEWRLGSRQHNCGQRVGVRAIIRRLGIKNCSGIEHGVPVRNQFGTDVQTLFHALIT
jgi:hypothetical protein